MREGKSQKLMTESSDLSIPRRRGTLMIRNGDAKENTTATNRRTGESRKK
jgi:hypothetical protein